MIDRANETVSYSPTIRIVGAIVADSPEFAIDSTLGGGSKKQRGIWCYQVDKAVKPSKAAATASPIGNLIIIVQTYKKHSEVTSALVCISRYLSADIVSTYNWSTHCIRYKKHGRPHALGWVLPSVIKIVLPLPCALIPLIHSVQIDSECHENTKNTNIPASLGIYQP